MAHYVFYGIVVYMYHVIALCVITGYACSGRVCTCMVSEHCRSDALQHSVLQQFMCVTSSITVCFQAADSKREEFRKYLEKAGVLDSLTKGMYVCLTPDCGLPD